MDNFIFTSSQYEQLKKEYEQVLQPNPTASLSLLNGIIKRLENNSFQMPLHLQNTIINNLFQAQQTLQILNPNHNLSSSLQFKNNVFSLLYYLSMLSNQLTSHLYKSAYQTIYLKSNNLIIKSITQISLYFTKK